ncbi:MAG TPA: hypothetical protein VGE02_03570 [Gemmatimonadales bacterium]
MTTTLAPDRALRPDIDPDPLRDVEAALSSMEWVTATHLVPGAGAQDARGIDRVVAIGRFLIVAISVLLVAAIIAVG